VQFVQFVAIPRRAHTCLERLRRAELTEKKQGFGEEQAALDRAWLRRVGVSLAAALAAGALVFLTARGALAVALFVQQQQLFAEVAGTLQGGIEGLASGDLRAARRQLQALDAAYLRVSLLAGFAAAAAAAVLVYLREERRAGTL
jgi:hypothetical protein